MTKERLVAFTDAVLAIIMTILILDLEKPSQVTLESLWDLRANFLAYTISFFWLGAMWFNMHRGWHDVKRISNKVTWNTLFLLFFSSFFPYTTNLVATHFQNGLAQIFYGVTSLLVTFFNTQMYQSLAEIPENTAMEEFMKSRRFMKWDVLTKILGLLGSAFIYPPLVMYSLILNVFLFIVPAAIRDYREKI